MVRVQELCNYLEEIGVLNMKTINSFLDEYQNVQIKFQGLDKQRKFSYTLCSFLKEMTKYDFEQMCGAIVKSFTYNDSIKKYNCLNRLNLILESRNRLAQANAFSLLKFNKLTSKANNARSKKVAKPYDFNDVQLSSIDRKEMDDLKECTFSPKITNTLTNLIKTKSIEKKIKSKSKSKPKTVNHSPIAIRNTTEGNKSLSLSKEVRELNINANLEAKKETIFDSKISKDSKNVQNVFGRLYNDVNERKDKQLNKTIERSIEESKELTFTPKVFPKNTSISKSCTNIRKSFDVEIDKFNRKKEKKIDEMRMRNEMKLDEACTFQPKSYVSSTHKRSVSSKFMEVPREMSKSTTLTVGGKKSSVHERLNVNYKVKNNYLYKNNKDLHLDYNNYTEANTKPKQKFSSNNFIKPVTETQNHFEKLYQDAGKIKQSKQKKTEKYFVDNGINFTPTLFENKNIRVDGNFEERNNRLLNLKKEVQQRLQLQEKEESYKIRKPTPDEIKMNNMRVVDRLYAKEIDKKREKEDKENRSSGNSTGKNNKLKAHQERLKKDSKIKYKRDKNTSSKSRDKRLEELEKKYTLDKDSYQANSYETSNRLNNSQGKDEGLSNTYFSGFSGRNPVNLIDNGDDGHLEQQEFSYKKEHDSFTESNARVNTIKNLYDDRDARNKDPRVLSSSSAFDMAVRTPEKSLSKEGSNRSPLVSPSSTIRKEQPSFHEYNSERKEHKPFTERPQKSPSPHLKKNSSSPIKIQTFSEKNQETTKKEYKSKALQRILNNKQFEPSRSSDRDSLT